MVGARLIAGLCSSRTASRSTWSYSGTTSRAERARDSAGRTKSVVASGSPGLLSAAKAFVLGTLPVVLRTSGGGGRFRLLVGPVLLPRPGLGPASKRLAAMELKPPAWSGACVDEECAGLGRSECGLSRDCSTCSTLGVSMIARVLGVSKVGRFSFAARL